MKMKPDRTNYELWLIDYLDGNLTGSEVEQLLSFLDENPDIKQESEGFSAIRVPLSEVSFVNKSSLKKSAAGLSDSQFDLYCAASLENDLTTEQKEELDEIIAGDNKRRETSGLFARTKLTAPHLIFPYKNRLKRLTLNQKIFRISLTALSTAATVLILLTLLKNQESDYRTAETVNQKQVNRTDKPDNEVKEQAKVTVPDKKVLANNPVVTNLTSKINETIAAEMKLFNEINHEADTAVHVNVSSISEMDKIGGLTEIPIENETGILSLVSLNLTPAESDDEEQGNAVGRFFTKIIRDKILKSEVPEKGSLKAYEVADAGITGLNKLFGSNMTLKKTLDDKGEVKSVYFNSRLIKFNAPVKKAEPME
jgi:hypothetical protein